MESHAVRTDGIEPSASSLSEKRSANELSALLVRHGRESNPCMEVLQTPALPLRHRAKPHKYIKTEAVLKEATIKNLSGKLKFF
jgi:hypothetical protein